jgi:hypothetical protein
VARCKKGGEGEENKKCLFWRMKRKWKWTCLDFGEPFNRILSHTKVAFSPLFSSSIIATNNMMDHLLKPGGDLSQHNNTQIERFSKISKIETHHVPTSFTRMFNSPHRWHRRCTIERFQSDREAATVNAPTSSGRLDALQSSSIFPYRLHGT